MLQMKGLCRDCDISPNDGDDLCIGSPIKCSFHTMHTIISEPKEIEQVLFSPINHYFSKNVV